MTTASHTVEQPTSYRTRTACRIVRQLIQEKKNGPAKHPIFLAGADALCIEEAIQNGIVTAESEPILIERDPALYLRMQQSYAALMEEHGFTKEPQYICDDITQISFGSLSIDYALIDWGQFLSCSKINWLYDGLAPALDTGTVAIISFVLGYRNNKCARAVHEAIAEDSVLLDDTEHWTRMSEIRDLHKRTRGWQQATPLVKTTLGLLYTIFGADAELVRAYRYNDAPTGRGPGMLCTSMRFYRKPVFENALTYAQERMRIDLGVMISKLNGAENDDTE